jgi:hypothetical protein
MRNTLALLMTFVVGYSVSDSARPSKAAEITRIPVQRFVPLNAESRKDEMLWSGFFALDTETGQLCRTVAEFEFNESAFSRLPSCVSLSHVVGKALN